MSGDDDKVVKISKAKAARVKAALEGAKPVELARMWKYYRTGPVQYDGKQIEPGIWEDYSRDDGLPAWCPIEPLGRDDDTYYFLNVGGGISTLSADKCGKGRMASLFAGATGFLVHAFPRFSANGHTHTPDNWANESAMARLFNAAHQRGAWNGSDRVRGRGAWRADNGSLILHLGDEVRSQAGVTRPGMVGRHVYVWRPELPAPASLADGAAPCGVELLEHLTTWNWRRGVTDARLMLGWIGAAMLGGWLTWRPNIFVTGERACGKSELQKYVKAVAGDFFVEAHDATAAGLHQYLGYDSVGVGVDEMEAEAGSRKTAAVIELARRASSGGRILRGGANHKGQDFIIQSCFLFSAIAPPSMRGQDLSRLCILELKPLEKAGAPPNQNITRLGNLGAEYLARLMQWVNTPGEEFGRFVELLMAFRCQLEAQGHENRTALQFGTLLAFAWAALHDDMPETERLHGDFNEIEEWCRDLRPGDMFETEGQLSTWQQCLNHMLYANGEPLRNTPAPSASAILMQLKAFLEDGPPAADNEKRLCPADAREKLAKIGLGLTTPVDPYTKKPEVMSWDNVQLFVPKSHPELSRLFAGTDWAAHGGADGTWINVLRQMDEDLWEKRKVRLGPMQPHGMVFRLKPLFERYLDNGEENDG